MSTLKVNTIQDTSGNTRPAGIGETDLWRVTSNFDSSNTDPITSNWERHDTHGPGLIGSGMSESNGNFNFPSTGVWRIDFYTTAYRISATNVRFINKYIKITTDNSSYGEAAYGTGSLSSDAEAFHTGFCSVIFDVTNVSTHKVKFFVQAEHELRWYANSNSNFIYAIFTKLGET